MHRFKKQADWHASRASSGLAKYVPCGTFRHSYKTNGEILIHIQNVCQRDNVVQLKITNLIKTYFTKSLYCFVILILVTIVDLFVL